MPVGFWDMMFDSEYRQRGDINQALELEGMLSSDVAALQTQVRSMTENMRNLSVTVAVLVQMLAEAKQLDPAVVRERAQAMLAELSKPPPPRPQPPESIAHPKPPPLNTAPIRCIKCGRNVPTNTTLMTGDGPVCDPACP